MLRSYMRHEPRDPGPGQKHALLKAGASERHIYEEDERKRGLGYPERDQLVASLRGPSEILVASLHNFAASIADLGEFVIDVLERGHTIIEGKTGRRSDDPAQLAAMIFDAMNFRSRKGLTTSAARKLGKLGAKASPATKKKKGLMPIREAQEIWRKPLLTIDEKLAEINSDKRYESYTLSMAYRRLGKTFAPAGRRAKTEE